MRYLPAISLLLLSSCGGGQPANTVETKPPPANHGEEVPPGVSEADKKRAAELSREATNLINARDNTAAAEKAEQAVKLNPDKPEYQAQLAYIYEKLGRYDEALVRYRSAVANLSGKDRGSALRGAARCALELARKARNKSDFASAEEFAKQAVELDSSVPAHHLELGHAYFMRKDYSRASEVYDRAASVAIGDEQFAALDWKGRAQFHGGEYRPAIETFTELIDRGADGLEAYGWRAYCWVQVGDKERAISDFNQAARLTNDGEKRAEYEDALRQLMQVEDGE